MTFYSPNLPERAIFENERIRSVGLHFWCGALGLVTKPRKQIFKSGDRVPLDIDFCMSGLKSGSQLVSDLRSKPFEPLQRTHEVRWPSFLVWRSMPSEQTS